MDMDPTSSSSSGMEVMMTPWLHFRGGDTLFFKTLHPSSRGAIAGACIVLVALAIFERWIAAMRGLLEKHWRERAMQLSYNQISEFTSSDMSCHPKGDSPMAIDEVDIDATDAMLNSKKVGIARPARTIPPFILSHDLSRGAVYSIQALLAYALMLAIMNFQAAYLIAIVAGSGIGEVLFGRMKGVVQGHLVH